MSSATRTRDRRVTGPATRDAAGPPARPTPPVHLAGPTITRFDTVSTQSRVLSATARRTVRPLVEAWARTPLLPWPAALVNASASAILSVTPTRGTLVRPVRLPRCRAEMIEAPGSGAGRTILYLHGGAFLCCGLQTHRPLVSRVSAAARGRVLSVDYRMLPQHPIATAVADALDGLAYLLDQGVRMDSLTIAGDSAGGFLVFEVARAALARGWGSPAALVALAPLTNLDPATKLASPTADSCAMFPSRALDGLNRVIGAADRRHRLTPTVSPVDGDLRGLPPTLIQVGSGELLYPDAVLMAERLAAAGTPCELEVWRDQLHVFQAAGDRLPESKAALDRIGTFIRARTRPTAPTLLDRAG